MEWIAYNSAVELAKLGNSVTLLTTNESTKIGNSEVISEDKVIGNINVVPAGPTTWQATGERDMFLNYSSWLKQEFGEGQGVIIDHSWWGYPYYLLSGGDITITPNEILHISPNPNMKLMHVIHGVTGWRRPSGEHVPPPGVQFPRILGVSPTHANYLNSVFKLPIRYVFNGVKIPDIGTEDSLASKAYLLSLNRISEEKGIRNVIDVCLETKTPLKIVGDDEHVSNQKYVWEIMDRCLKSGGLIEYVGAVDNDRKWEYIRNCRGLICCPDPSNYVESFYMASVEGWSLGKPILALANGGLNDIVVDGVNGFKCANTSEMKDILINGKEVFVIQDEGKEYNGTSLECYLKKRIKLEDISPESCKQEANKYTVENMALGYYEICKGIEAKDQSFNW